MSFRAKDRREMHREQNRIIFGNNTCSSSLETTTIHLKLKSRGWSEVEFGKEKSEHVTLS
jgi:hypothetical protein